MAISKVINPQSPKLPLYKEILQILTKLRKIFVISCWFQEKALFLQKLLLADDYNEVGQYKTRDSQTILKIWQNEEK